MATDNSPFKGEGETVYATEPTQNEDDSGSLDTANYKDKEWLHYQYNILGKPQDDIADISGVAYSTINYWMDKHGIPRRSQSRATSKGMGGHELLWDEEWLRDQYVSKKKSTPEIAANLDVTGRTVQNALRRYDIPTRSNPSRVELAREKEYGGEKYNDETWLEWQYIKQQKSAPEIAEENGWSATVVREALERNGIPIRSKEEAQLLRYKKEKGTRDKNTRELVHSGGIDASWADLADVNREVSVQYRDKDWLQSQVHRGLNMEQIASKCSTDVSRPTISRWVDIYDIDRSDPGYSPDTKLDPDDSYRDQEWLYSHYWDDEMTTDEIADMCGVSGTTILNWMDKFDISRR